MDHGFRKSIKKGMDFYILLSDDVAYFSEQLRLVKEALDLYKINSKIEIVGNIIQLLINDEKFISVNHVKKEFSSDFFQTIFYEDREFIIRYAQSILSSSSFWIAVEGI